MDSIEHGSFLQPATLQLMKQKGVYLVPTRMTQRWVVTKAEPIRRRSATRRARPAPRTTA